MMVEWDLLAFAVLSGGAIGSALLLVRAREVVHSVFYLAGVFASVAGLFFLLNAEFVGIVQVLINIGAVTVLILFAIMLTRRRIMEASK